MCEPISSPPGWVLGDLVHAGIHTHVFLARPSGSAHVADFDYCLKSLLPSSQSDPDRPARFRREGLLGYRLSDPHLPSVVAADLECPTPFFVMPRIPGATIATVLQRARTFAVPRALSVGRQVAHALAKLHENGWLHRDLRSANVIVSRSGHATVIDLGSVSPLDGSESSGRPYLAGDPRYIAPEQFVSRCQASTASDVYSLGILLFEMLMGFPPFQDSDPARLVERHLREQPPSPRTYLRDLPPDLGRCLAAMLAKEPLRRPRLDGELQQRLTRLEIDTFVGYHKCHLEAFDEVSQELSR